MYGEVSERFKELVLKTSDAKAPRVRISASPPLQFYIQIRRSTQVGRRGAPAKGVGRETGARVQISPSPPLLKYTFVKIKSVFIFYFLPFTQFSVSKETENCFMFLFLRHCKIHTCIL